MEKKLALILGYKCNNNCRFCYCADKKNFTFLSTNKAKKELDDGRRRGCTFVDFLGGEPTLRKDLPDLLKYSKDLGYKTISITTNGRMFSYEKIAKELIYSGLNSVVFSLHGHNSYLHDFLTRSDGSFEQLNKGAENIKNINSEIYLCTNTTITKYNYRYLPEIAKKNIEIGADGCEFIFVHPRGNALKNFYDVVPKLESVRSFIPKTLEIGKRFNVKHFEFRYFPLCYVPKNSLSEFVSLENLREQHVGPEFKDLNVELGRKNIGRVKGKKCKECIYDNICEGVFKEYADRYGLEELKPVVK